MKQIVQSPSTFWMQRKNVGESETTFKLKINP